MWSNNQSGRRRIWQRLDRVVGNGEVFIHLPELKIRHLQRLISDHAPLLVCLAQPAPYRSKFVFQKMWMEHNDFRGVVEQIWSQPVSGAPSLVVDEKLRRLKAKLKVWNWEEFGDLKEKIIQLQNRVMQLEEKIQYRPTQTDEEEFENCSRELRQAVNWEAELVYQKTRAKWIQDGDRNTKFFHAVIRDKMRQNAISLTDPNGEIISNPE